MRMMKMGNCDAVRRSWVLAAILLAAPALAKNGLVTNPDLPYPPGCAGDPGRTLVPFVEGQSVRLPDHFGGASVPFDVHGFRATCSEPGRSVIWLRFSYTGPDDRNFVVEVPSAWAILPERAGPIMALVKNPNGWGVESDPNLGRRFLVHAVPSTDGYSHGAYTTTREWDLLLENLPDLPRYPHAALTPAEYNDAFRLRLGYLEWWDFLLELEIPPTAAMSPVEPGIPLSGRLSGLWVVEGAADQGFMLSVSNRVAAQDSLLMPREAQPLVLFLAHFTYNAAGQLLWLTGAAAVAQGEREATFPIERVTGGRFMGDGVAERSVVGSVRLTANGCDDLTLEYEYGALGLGTGSVRLQRFHSLETAGNDCRDYAARVAANR